MRWRVALSSVVVALVTIIATPGRAEAPVLSGVPCPAEPKLSLSAYDVFRLEHLTSSRTRGLAGAANAGSAVDRAVVAGLFEAGLAPLASVAVGHYRCRTIKMGGPVPLTIYDWFECEITALGAGFRIEKLTGSQRLSGTLTPAGDGLAYRGALHYREEAPRPYEGVSERDQVGCLVRQFEDGGSLILELPYPRFESAHDVLELKPAGSR